MRIGWQGGNGRPEIKLLYEIRWLPAAATFIWRSGRIDIILPSEVRLMEEAKMKRLMQRAWLMLFALAVTCSLVFSSVAFAINDPK